MCTVNVIYDAIKCPTHWALSSVKTGSNPPPTAREGGGGRYIDRCVTAITRSWLVPKINLQLLYKTTCLVQGLFGFLPCVVSEYITFALT